MITLTQPLVRPLYGFRASLKGMSPHIRYWNVTIIRTRGRELSKNAIGPAHVHTSSRLGRWVPPLRLPLFSAILASVPAPAPEPAYPAPRLPLLQRSGWRQWVNGYQEGAMAMVAGGPGRRHWQARRTGEKRGGRGRWLGRRQDYLGESEMDEAQGRLWGSGTSAGRLTLETLKDADEAWVGWFGCRLVRVQAPALRWEPQRSEGGVACEPARLHSCSKFTTPGSYYSNISK